MPTAVTQIANREGHTAAKAARLASYSGAVPNEKITWGKLEAATPRFVIESDASIVAPLMFAYILGQ